VKGFLGPMIILAMITKIGSQGHYKIIKVYSKHHTNGTKAIAKGLWSPLISVEQITVFY